MSLINFTSMEIIKRLKQIFLSTIFSYSAAMIASCKIPITKVYAPNYTFEKYYKEPKQNMRVYRLIKPSYNYYFSIYEIDKKKSRINPIYVEDYEYNNYGIQIHYYYKQMARKDGIITDDELIPIVIDSKSYRIIAYDWPFVDSIKKTTIIKRK
jgi:hypothetical protein